MLLPSQSALSSVVPSRDAFTLTELLVVMAVIVLIIGLSGPAITSMKNAGDVSRTVYDVAGVLEQSRAYAMGNNTYVYVGVAEVDATQPRTGTQRPGTGRLSIAVVATRDGTQGFSSSNIQNWSSSYSNFSRNLAVVGKPLVFENVHVPDLGTPPTTGNMARPALGTNSTGSMSYSLGSSRCISSTPFDYPVGSNLNGGQYSFTKVIQFDPQGVARIQTATNPSAITTYMEIGLQQARGANVPTLPASPTTGDIAAIQIDGMTGMVRIYRP